MQRSHWFPGASEAFRVGPVRLTFGHRDGFVLDGEVRATMGFRPATTGTADEISSELSVAVRQHDRTITLAIEPGEVAATTAPWQTSTVFYRLTLRFRSSYGSLETVTVDAFAPLDALAARRIAKSGNVEHYIARVLDSTYFDFRGPNAWNPATDSEVPIDLQSRRPSRH